MTYPESFNEAWNLNPGTNKEHTYGLICKGLEKKNVSLDVLTSSYKKYYSWWGNIYGKRDAKYISKDNQLLGIYDFLAYNYHNKKWNNPNILRDSPKTRSSS